MNGLRTIWLLLTAATLLTAQGAERFARYRHAFNYDTLALQVQLDRLNLSCNCIDGYWGARTEIALMTWQLLNGLEPTGKPDAKVLDALGGDTNVLQSVVVSASDYAGLVAIPADWKARARLASMNYSSVLERLAERSHATEGLLRRLNPSVQWPNPTVGTVVRLPACNPPGRRKREYATVLRISLSRMEITAFNAEGKLIALFPCSIAREKAHRPAGQLAVKNVAANPTYLYDPQLFTPGTKDKVKLQIPAGPNNPVGTGWIGLSLQGYGIHGTPSPDKIGQAASHGCFRLANWNANKLMHMVSPGVPILVEE
ncbi:MAG: murein L,D-transpeptidase [Kiritimatiellae bacterium]|nr:murein L,D-transpeptidase [Kiritimatiellia bacterium]